MWLISSMDFFAYRESYFNRILEMYDEYNDKLPAQYVEELKQSMRK